MRAYVYTGLVSSNGSCLSSPSIPRVSLSSRFSLTLARSRWLQDNQSGRRLPRSGFRSHRTGGDSRGNKELKKRTEKEVARATPPGHRWSSPKEICAPSSPSRPDRNRGYCPSHIPPRSHEFRRRLRATPLFREGDRNPGPYHRVLSKPDFDGRAIMYANGHCASRGSGKRESAATMGWTHRP